MKALIIVDMVNDYVAGAPGCEALANEAQAKAIIPAIRRLIDHARADEEWVTVYANTAHRADDREIDIWGRHALAGTHGAQVIEALAPVGAEREIVLAKRHYGAFDKTDLDDILFDYDVADVILVGQHTHRGIAHTAYGAFLSGYDLHVPMDAVCSLPSTDNQAALGALREMYGANLTTSIALIGRPVLRTASFNPAK